jgi:serine/threonine-protein kinase
MEGSLLGTPTFMAPEMAMGRSDVDARADVYALGCVAYWLLVGQVPLLGSTAMETILMHVQEAAPRASASVDVPRELDALVASCLQKDPSQRPEDAATLLEMLDDIPIETPWTESRAARWWRGDR